jgi:hypothetical protein
MARLRGLEAWRGAAEVLICCNEDEEVVEREEMLVGGEVIEL